MKDKIDNLIEGKFVNRVMPGFRRKLETTICINQTCLSQNAVLAFQALDGKSTKNHSIGNRLSRVWVTLHSGHSV